MADQESNGGLQQQQQPPQHQQQPQRNSPPPPLRRDTDKQERDDVCRDFLKNICNRGSRCKFYHPPDAQVAGEYDFNFCIDYQNRGCMRDNCRFVHAPREEVERYKSTRELTLILARAIVAAGHCDSIGGIPVCKEFQTGRCARGANRCRYWHVNIEMERDRRKRGLPPTNEFARFPPPDMELPPYGRRRPMPGYDEYDIEPKRGRMDYSSERVIDLEKRNAELQKEVDSLKRELKREHERYEDLYALFRQQSGGAPAPPKPPVAAGGGGGADYYAAWATSGGPPSGW